MDQATKEKLAREHMDLLDVVARKMKHRFGSGVDVDDLRSFAMMGLAKAIENYDSERETTFSAYAAVKMKGAIYDGLIELAWLPRNLARKIAFYQRAEEMTRYASEDPPPTDKKEGVHRLGEILKDIASTYITTYAGPVKEEHLTSPAESEIQTEINKYYARVRAYVAVLPEHQQNLIRMHYFEEASLREAADYQGHSKAWASRSLRSALKLLRQQFEDAEEHPLDEFT